MRVGLEGKHHVECNRTREAELQRLQGHPNFPKLIDYNEKELTITMDYCGEKYVDDVESETAKNNIDDPEAQKLFEEFGTKYAQDIVANAKVLASSLAKPFLFSSIFEPSYLSLSIFS